MKLSKNEILEYQQNRDPYLMIDYVDELVPGKSVKGFKILKEENLLALSNFNYFFR